MVFGVAFVKGSIRLRDEIVLFFVPREEVHLIGDTPIDDLAIRRFDKAEIVDPRKGGHGRDKSDVRAFRRLNGADAAVM